MALLCRLRALHALHHPLPPLSARGGTGVLQSSSYHAGALSVGASARRRRRHRYAHSAAAAAQRSFAAPAAAAAAPAAAVAAAPTAAPAAPAAAATSAAPSAAAASLTQAKPAAPAAAATTAAAPTTAPVAATQATAAAAQRSSSSSSSQAAAEASGGADAVANLTLMQAASPGAAATDAATTEAATPAANPNNPASQRPADHYWQSAKKVGGAVGSGTLKGTTLVLHLAGRGFKWLLRFLSLTPRFKSVLMKTGVGDEDVALLMSRMGALSVYTTVSMSAMSALGIDYSPVLAVTGLAGATIGFAAREILGGFMMGANLLLFRRFERGDLITIDGITGIVEGLDLSRLNLRDPDTRALTQIPATKAFTFPIILHQPPSQKKDIQPPTLATLPQKVEEHKLAQKPVIQKIKRYEVKSKGERENASPMGSLEDSPKSDDSDDNWKENIAPRRGGVKWLARS